MIRLEEITEIAQVAEFLSKQKEVAVFSHINPDGDAIGSMASLGMALEKCGIKVRLYNCDKVAEKFHFLACFSQFEVYAGEPLCDTVIVLDCATMQRTGLADFTDALKGRTIVNIDHHIGNEDFGDYRYINSAAAANCENVYRVIKAMNIALDCDIATALYLGISTDSGSFKYDAVTADTHRITAELLDNGARQDSVRLNMYESISKAKFALQKYVYSHVEFYADGKIAAMIPLSLLEETQADSADLDGVVNILKDIDGVEIAMLFREKENGLKLSLRSKDYVDVNQLAAQFGGGGHIRAAGATIGMNYAQAKENILPAAIATLK